MIERIVIGSRGSELALAQANYIAGELRRLSPGTAVEIEIIVSKGDMILDVPLAKIGGKGLFTKELETALLEGQIDLAVHSLKDLPTELPEGLEVAAIPPREDPHDVYISKGGIPLDALRVGARIGTSSVRRRAQLLNYRPDLEIVDLRGNVPTRLRKLESEGLDAIVLAAAGLKRLGLQDRITDYIEESIMLPAPGQGALALEVRVNAVELIALLRGLHDPAAALEVIAERALLQALGGGCQTPVGALARVSDDELYLVACVADPEGRIVLRTELVAPLAGAAALGSAAAEHLLKQGARKIFAGEVGPLTGNRVLTTRPEFGEDPLDEQLAHHGAEVVHLPVTEIVVMAPEEDLPDAKDLDWIVFTSANGVRGLDHAFRFHGRSWDEYRAVKCCTVGPATAQTLRKHGVTPDLTPNEFHAEAITPALVAIEGSLHGKRVLWPKGNLARSVLSDALVNAGASLTDYVVYETRARAVSEGELEEALQPLPDAVVFTSPSGVRQLCAALGRQWRRDLTVLTPAACIGPATAEAAENVGFRLMPVPRQHTVRALVKVLVDSLGR